MYGVFKTTVIDSDFYSELVNLRVYYKKLEAELLWDLLNSQNKDEFTVYEIKELEVIS